MVLLLRVRIVFSSVRLAAVALKQPSCFGGSKGFLLLIFLASSRFTLLPVGRANNVGFDLDVSAILCPHKYVVRGDMKRGFPFF